MIYNRYAGLKKLYKRGSPGRKAMYLLIKPYLTVKTKRLSARGGLMKEVEIETVNRCNGVCPFCPVNRNVESRPYARMTDELFERILIQLGEMGYAGRLGLYSNNEPFLDTRIIEFARKARNMVPKAFIHLYTNGSLLTREKVLAIMPYLDRMIIDNYNDNLELNDNVREINELCREQEGNLDKKIVIHLRRLNEVLYTRGGQAPNNLKKKIFHMPCVYPFEQMVIRPDGKVSLCCNDALGKWTMGDLKEQSLIEIWNSWEYREVRAKLMKGRSEIELCRYCDTFSL